MPSYTPQELAAIRQAQVLDIIQARGKLGGVPERTPAPAAAIPPAAVTAATAVSPLAAPRPESASPPAGGTGLNPFALTSQASVAVRPRAPEPETISAGPGMLALGVACIVAAIWLKRAWS